MEKIAFISGGVFVYWSSIILTLAVLAAMAVYAGMYIFKSGNVLAAAVTLPVAMVLSAVLARLIHWYCRTDSYSSMLEALTDYSWGGYALMGVFVGCLLTALLLRVLGISKNLPQMLDSVAIGGGVGIAVGRLASFFNASDRGILVSEELGLPFAYQVTNAVSGVVENRLATFMIQAIVAGALVLLLLAYMGVCKIRKKELIHGDICLMFLTVYGASQILLDSTRYDSLFMRSNGFISIVQILSLVAVLVPLVVFSVRMVKNCGLKGYQSALWAGNLAMMGGAGYMEYYVQRHGDKAAFAYTVMGICLAVICVLVLVIRAISLMGKVAEEEQAEEHVELPEFFFEQKPEKPVKAPKTPKAPKEPKPEKAPKPPKAPKEPKPAREFKFKKQTKQEEPVQTNVLDVWGNSAAFNLPVKETEKIPEVEVEKTPVHFEQKIQTPVIPMEEERKPVEEEKGEPVIWLG